MFPLHERTRRRLALLAFLLLCPLPTVIVLACGVARHLPGHARAEAKRLSTHLGVAVHIDAVRHPRPGVVVYEGLTFSDPETSQTMLRCGLLEASRPKSIDGQRRSPSAVKVAVGEAEIEVAQLSRLGRVLRRVLRRGAGWPEVDLHVTAGRLALRQKDGRQTALTDVEGRVETLSTEARAEIGFRLADFEMPEPARLQVVRSRRTEPPATGFALQSGAGALPCRVLAMGLPGLETLGPGSRFCGYLWANQMPDGWEGELAGRFSDVDLARVITDRFGHRLSGTAEVSVQFARFRRGRLQQAAASIAAGPGTIGRSLLDASAEWMGMVPRAESDVPGDPVPFDELRMSLVVDSAGLELRGHCSGVHPGVVVAGRDGPLLAEPTSQPRPVAAVLATLVPGAGVHVPATRQTEWLIRRLPLPEALPR